MRFKVLEIIIHSYFFILHYSFDEEKGRLFAAAFLFVLLLAPVGAGLALLGGSLGSGLSLAGDGELEVDVLADVPLEAASGLEGHVQALDVGLAEGLEGGDGVAVLVHAGAGTVAGDGELELAQGAELDVVALEQRLAGAGHHVGEDTEDGTFREHRTVAADVLAQELEINDAVALHRGVSFLGLIGFHGVSTHGGAVLDGFFHNLKTHPQAPPVREGGWLRVVSAKCGGLQGHFSNG